MPEERPGALGDSLGKLHDGSHGTSDADTSAPVKAVER